MSSSVCFGLCGSGTLRAACTGRGQLCDVRAARPRRSPAKRARPSCSAKRRDIDPDDLPEAFPEGDELPTKLTLAQELLMKSYRDQVDRMSKAECDDLTVEIMRQNFVKDNILRTMGIKTPEGWLQPPDPDVFKESLASGENEASGSSSSTLPGGLPMRGSSTPDSGDVNPADKGDEETKPTNNSRDGDIDDSGESGDPDRDPDGDGLDSGSGDPGKSA